MIRPGENGAWRVTAKIQFGANIFSTLFKVQRNGRVDMGDDEPLVANVPFVKERFIKGMRTRLPGQMELVKGELKGC